MTTVQGDIWDWHPRVPVVIPVGAGLNKRGEAIMQRGLPRQARDRYPHLPQFLGRRIIDQGSRVEMLPHNLIALPVEIDPFEVARPDLIRTSLQQLVVLANAQGWKEIALPRLGCGGGMLTWEEIRPFMSQVLDDRFVLVAPLNLEKITQ